MKGRTCKTCAGTCCQGITYHWDGHIKSDPEIAKLIDKKDHRNNTHCNLLKLGYVFIFDPKPEETCSHYKDGRCDEYDKRPLLCKSFWCHGKLWRPRDAF